MLKLVNTISIYAKCDAWMDGKERTVNEANVFKMFLEKCFFMLFILIFMFYTSMLGACPVFDSPFIQKSLTYSCCWLRSCTFISSLDIWSKCFYLRIWTILKPVLHLMRCIDSCLKEISLTTIIHEHACKTRQIHFLSFDRCHHLHVAHYHLHWAASWFNAKTS